MELKELRGKSNKELTKLLQEAGEGLLKLRADRKTGSLSDGSKVSKKRSEIARILTVLREKEILKDADARSKESD
jgi:ribosomal protein L29